MTRTTNDVSDAHKYLCVTYHGNLSSIHNPGVDNTILAAKVFDVAWLLDSFEAHFDNHTTALSNYVRLHDEQYYDPLLFYSLRNNVRDKCMSLLEPAETNDAFHRVHLHNRYLHDNNVSPGSVLPNRKQRVVFY